MAGDEYETSPAEVRFVVKEGTTQGNFFIAIEPLRGSNLPILDGGFLTLDLTKGTTAEKAREIANLLDNHVPSAAYTGPKIQLRRR